MAYHRPGNVRQLEHVIERAVRLAAKRERLYLGDIQLPVPTRNRQIFTPEIDISLQDFNFDKVIGEVESLLIQEALRKCDGNKAKASRALGLKRSTMLYKSKAHEAKAS
jgi:transcriptional regulator with PAS, ATPase and Fis domain